MAKIEQLEDAFRSLSPRKKKEFIATLSEEEAGRLLFSWRLWARDKQLAPPGDWLVWLILAGRGFGKTRAGAEWVRSMVEAGKWGRIALVAQNSASGRDVMVEGESGILTISPPWFKPEYEPSKRRLTWPNGATATLFSSEEPDRLRGPQFHGAWVDELPSFAYPDETWDMLMFGLRLGEHPQVGITTTPRPITLLKEIIADEATVVVKGNTYENRSNLAASFFRHITTRFEGTRMGEQELYAELLEDMPGALWTRELLANCYIDRLPMLEDVIIAVDPALTQGKRADETGIMVVGKTYDDDLITIADESMRGSPQSWAREVVKAAHKYAASRVIAETNMGGDLVEILIKDVDSSIRFVKTHSRKNKQTRAEPVVALYEQGRAFHLRKFKTLEDQMCTFVPGETKKSPDRLDALVIAATELIQKKYRRFQVV